MSTGETESPEVDYRFTLANERTFLAWMRTALGLLAGGVALRELVASAPHEGLRVAVAGACIVLAGVVALAAYVRWRQVESAMRRGANVPRSVLVPALAVGIAVLALLVCVGSVRS